MRLATCLVIIVVATGSMMSLAIAQDKPNPNAISPKEAAQQVGKRVTMRMGVRSTFKDVNHRLHNTPDPHSPRGFAVVIPQAALPEFKKVNIDDPATFYNLKTIQVTGKVQAIKSGSRMIVTNPKDILVIAD
jgi:hypothetical protein